MRKRKQLHRQMRRQESICAPIGTTVENSSNSGLKVWDPGAVSLWQVFVSLSAVKEEHSKGQKAKTKTSRSQAAGWLSLAVALNSLCWGILLQALYGQKGHTRLLATRL